MELIYLGITYAYLHVVPSDEAYALNLSDLSQPTSRLCAARYAFALVMNLARDAEVETIFEKYSDGKFLPPKRERTSPDCTHATPAADAEACGGITSRQSTR